MRRRLTPEIMDQPDTDERDLDRALSYIKSINRWMGGVAALELGIRDLRPLLPTDRPVTLLDVATGAADLPIEARGRALERGDDLRVTGIDLHPTTLRLAERDVAACDAAVQDGITLELLDAFEIANRFGDNAFDIVHAGLFLHHLPDDRVPEMLGLMARVARVGVIWNDLVRSRVGLAAIHLMTIGQPRIVRHDACHSVRAGFTRVEALRHCEHTGWRDSRFQWSLFTHRFTVVARTGATA